MWLTIRQEMMGILAEVEVHPGRINKMTEIRSFIVIITTKYNPPNIYGLMSNVLKSDQKLKTLVEGIQEIPNSLNESMLASISLLTRIKQKF